MPDVAVRPVRTVALCAGVGALELGVDLALAGATEPLAYVERDPFAAAVLVARMEDATLGQAPIWDDLATFDGTAFRGLVDLVTAGFPCQPFSQAGQRAGLDDVRWLWPHVARVVREMGPDYLFVENVRGFLAEHGGLRAVLGDLSDLGFDAEWQVLSAGQMGASHERERFWLLAYHHDRRQPFLGRLQPRLGSWEHADRLGGAPVDDAGGAGRSEVTRSAHGDEAAHEGRATIDGDEPDGAVEDVADAERLQGGERAWPDLLGRRPRATKQARVGGVSVANSTSSGREGRSGSERRLPRPHEIGPLFPPGPDQLDEWRRVLEFDPSLEPSLHGMADGLAYRLDRSHAIGNGVVPLVAAASLVGLARRAGVWEEHDARAIA